MTAKKKAKAVKRVAKKKAVKSVKLVKSASTEREQVRYNFDTVKKTIEAISHCKNRDTSKMTEHKFVINAQAVKELKERQDDLKRFYSYCNAELKLLTHLKCDAQAKKLHICTNTQYDSRKKLRALIMQISLSSAKQKAKTKKTSKKEAKSASK